MLAETDISQIGIALVCLLWIIKMMGDGVLKLKSPKQDNNSEVNFRRDMYEMKAQTHDLHSWHDKEDEDGRKIWYVKASFEKAITDNTTTVRENTAELIKLQQTIQALDN